MSDEEETIINNAIRRTFSAETHKKKVEDRQDKGKDSPEVERRHRRPNPPRAPLKARDQQVDLESLVGKTQVVTNTTPLAHQAGYFCDVCQCVVKDSANYLDHINGKKHQRALGMSMRVERVGVDAIKAKMREGAKQKRKEVTDNDIEDRLRRLQEDEDERKKRKKDKKKDKKDDNDNDGDDDDAMLAALGLPTSFTR
eukprot:c20301_g1_i1.p1 GENE.c20301_g1_i1~~c20301_g1_i1.p1  ORF type:complete len:219 (-),score=71.62 c20301_g1_i1:245-838(-)